METQASLPPVLDERSFSSLVPDGLFYKTEPSQEYQFMLRYITRLLSLVDHSEDCLAASLKHPIECHFIQRNQEVQSSSARFQADARFVAELTMRCCFSVTTVLTALEYMIRLQSKGVVRLHSTSWKTVFVVCCLLGEKMWEDNYVHPSHIISQYGYLAKGGNNIPKRDFLALQLLLVGAISWSVNVPVDRYRELITSIMGVSVPHAIHKTLPAGYAGCVPRPLPPLPRMNLPTQSSRPRAPITSVTDTASIYTRTSSATSSIAIAEEDRALRSKWSDRGSNSASPF
jgi:hypothetical protein